MALLCTPLDELHRELGARMVPFAGYDMPVQYGTGIIAEHRHTRAAAGLFDVSHMGQYVLEGSGVTAALEALVPADLESLQDHRQTYTLLTNDQGGVRDDLIVTRWGPDTLFLVVNAACKEADAQHIRAHLTAGQTLRELPGQGLLALQGPGAREALKQILPGVAELVFLSGDRFELDGDSIYVTCSGYTGEDGFEVSLPGALATDLTRRLLALDAVEPAGLGARDSLRLEAGLCLYGHELSPTITPVSAGLNWTIAKARRPGGAREGGYPGNQVIAGELERGAERRRVGLRVLGKRPVREGQAILDDRGQVAGEITSGGFGASIDTPVAMGFVTRELAGPGQPLRVDVRGKPVDVEVCALPMVPARYYRG